jgi:hypothetical protein
MEMPLLAPGLNGFPADRRTKVITAACRSGRGSAKSGKRKEIHLILTTTREFLEELKKSVKASLEAAGYSANYQDSQRWPATFIVSSSGSQGGVTLIFGEVCEHCGESLSYRVQNSQGAFGGRGAIPRDCDAATAADCLVREALPLLTNRLPAATQLNRGIGVGLLSPQDAGKLSEALKAGSH